MTSINPSIFKAYDVRGVYPKELNNETAYEIGFAFADFLKAKDIAVGRDNRLSSPAIFEHLTKGIRDQGTDVIDLGLVTTDMVYFAVGKLGFGGGIMITASHNPPAYNGLKFCRERALPVSSENGLFEMRDKILQGLYAAPAPFSLGKLTAENIMNHWLNHVLTFIDPTQLKPLNVVVDAGNGMAGVVMPELAKRVPLKIIPMYFELDGTFPNHLPSPLEEKNVRGLQDKVLEEHADLGMIFDGDADRVFLVDDVGAIVSGTVMTAIIADSLLSKHPKETVLYNAICGRIVPEVIAKYEGKAVRTRVGHSLIKENMRETGAIFAGEHSGHYYFHENFGADSALIAAMIVLEIVSKSGQKLSDFRKPYEKYFQSGEINSEVQDVPKILKNIEEKFSDASIDHLDGLTVAYPDWWANVRPSNTEPLLRLNVEANSKGLMEEKRDVLLNIIRG